MENNENIKEAKEELDKISQDDILRRMALKAEIQRMDQEELIYEARRDGKKEGEQKAILETAKKMLVKGIDIETVIEITGLTKKEIMQIQ